MKKTILFVILQQYADWEAAYIASAITMLGQGQYDIKTVSLSKDYVQSIGDFRYYQIMILNLLQKIMKL